MKKEIIHLQHPFDKKKSKDWNVIAKYSTLCWQSKGKRTTNKELVTCKKCLFQMNKKAKEIKTIAIVDDLDNPKNDKKIVKRIKKIIKKMKIDEIIDLKKVGNK